MDQKKTKIKSLINDDLEKSLSNEFDIESDDNSNDKIESDDEINNDESNE